MAVLEAVLRLRAELPRFPGLTGFLRLIGFLGLAVRMMMPRSAMGRQWQPAPGLGRPGWWPEMARPGNGLARPVTPFSWCLTW
jgi:hypothetical protein